MFKRLLIANRGEIACRIIRTARRLGIETVAVFSDADHGALHVEMADHAVRIGPGPASESYLNADRIIAAAGSAGADAVHPGYGFLSESPAFSDACVGAGLGFVGPTGRAMRDLGDKASAKRLARASGVNVVPGYDGDGQSEQDLTDAAAGVGYPLLIKAVAGGGGRGMRPVADSSQFQAQLASARREAMASFGDDRVILEKLIVRPRHVEVQVFADRHGNVVHLFERECTLQRRHQKVLEEAPADGMSPGLREKLTGAARNLAAAARYEGAGTVEFLVEGGSLGEAANWYFIEMNTRLQVEHPVTEAVTGLDLVAWQLVVAAGGRLPLGQDAIASTGHAVEVRLCAEDPADAFRPSPGRIVAWQEPCIDGVRIDSGFGEGREIPAHYDSLLAKVICHRPSRVAALEAVREALGQFDVAGPRTNAAFLRRLVARDEVARGQIDTGFIDRNLGVLAARDPDPAAIGAGARALLVARAGDGAAGPAVVQGFGLGEARRVAYRFVADGAPVEVVATWTEGAASYAVGGSAIPEVDLDRCKVFRAGDTAYVLSDLAQTIVAWPDWAGMLAADEPGGGMSVAAPITGRIAVLSVKPGDKVLKGAEIGVVEAMKMEHIVKAPRDGAIATVDVAAGDQIAAGQVMATFAGDDVA